MGYKATVGSKVAMLRALTGPPRQGAGQPSRYLRQTSGLSVSTTKKHLSQVTGWNASQERGGSPSHFDFCLQCCTSDLIESSMSSRPHSVQSLE